MYSYHLACGSIQSLSISFCAEDLTDGIKLVSLLSLLVTMAVNVIGHHRFHTYKGPRPHAQVPESREPQLYQECSFL